MTSRSRAAPSGVDSSAADDRRSWCGGAPVRRVIYSMGVSLDGYIVGPDGDITAPPPDEDFWRFVTDEMWTLIPRRYRLAG